ncbi:hypothetical protein GHK92_10385 [Nocardioides sp. dk4132]|uniref:hypothetical protein n=1 Tax=unclassified Nocardioides TaxID=2615069 RepID=UPI0012949046|nr:MULTISPECIES: hypothetical protein [unclassified Nocardioides]MQW76284.1 hypothetical protein [Nocardioides sp. dk4132]QGA07432.1 hypothetical protein GFH29_08540 [Nocardioides sp. dk884]
MPTAPAERRRTLARLLLLVLLTGGLLSACSLGGDDEPPAPGAVPEDVVDGLSRVLERRAGAVRRGDRAAFLRQLAPRPELREQQLTHFENLRQLPLADYRYTFDRADLVREDDAYWLTVSLHLQLDGYDAVPVVTRNRFRFSPARRAGAFRLDSLSDPAWEKRAGVRPEPWDTGPVVVRTGHGVLGIFDADSVAAAPALIDSVEDGIADVSASVPYGWSRSVVVYALSDDEFLRALPPPAGGALSDLDGLAFPVAAAPDDPTLAGTRFVLHPRMLDAAGAERDRLVRHEITHVAVGERDDRAPVWLSEGIAEYVSVQPMAPEERRLVTSAVGAAATGFRGLPRDEDFNGPGSSVNYAVSWWAVESLVRRFGPDAPFALLDAAAAGDAGTPRLLSQMFGTRPRELAADAARLILTTYS